MTKNNTLVLFDFDGTITRKDTFIEFIKFARGKVRFWFGIWLLCPMLILYVLKLIRNDRAKTYMFRYFFKGWSAERFKKAGEDFCEQVLPSMIKPSAAEKIKFHQDNQDRVIIVTASGKEWIEPWCKKMNVELISTEIEIKENKITGKLCTANCYGAEKVNRIKALLDPAEFSSIYAYGDSRGDKEMLELAHNPHFKHFND